MAKMEKLENFLPRSGQVKLWIKMGKIFHHLINKEEKVKIMAKEKVKMHQ